MESVRCTMQRVAVLEVDLTVVGWASVVVVAVVLVEREGTVVVEV